MPHYKTTSYSADKSYQAISCTGTDNYAYINQEKYTKKLTQKHINWLQFRINKMLSYRRETALQGAL